MSDSQSNNDEDYEHVLAALASNIQKRQIKLSEIRLRERRSTLLTTVYAVTLWVAYVSLWYANIIPNIGGHQRKTGIGKVALAAPVVVGPVMYVISLHSIGPLNTIRPKNTVHSPYCAGLV
jgi:hypothetical protein